MQIRFNEVLAPDMLMTKLTAVLGDLEKLGLKQMTDVRIELRPGTVGDQVMIASADGDCPDITTIDVEPGGKVAGEFSWRPVQSKRAETHRLASDAITFNELMARNWAEVDICGPLGTLSSSDDPAALVPRLLRMILSLMTDDAQVSDGGDDDAIGQPTSRNHCSATGAIGMPRVTMTVSSQRSRSGFSTDRSMIKRVSGTTLFATSPRSGACRCPACRNSSRTQSWKACRRSCSHA